MTERITMKSIANCEGYFVSDKGEIYSCIKKFPRRGYGRGTYTIVDESSPVKLTPWVNKHNGYVYCSLGKYGQKRLHRVVAEAYIPNPNNLSEVNHIDEDKTNNNVDNLEWCDRQHNAEHSLAKHYLIEHIASGDIFPIYNLSSFCRENDLHIGSLHDTLKGRLGRKQCGGFRIIDKIKGG